MPFVVLVKIMNEKVDFEESSSLKKKKKEIKSLECESDDEFQAFIRRYTKTTETMIYKKRFPFEWESCEMGKKGMREEINYSTNKSYFGALSRLKIGALSLSSNLTTSLLTNIFANSATDLLFFVDREQILFIVVFFFKSTKCLLCLLIFWDKFFLVVNFFVANNCREKS